MVFVNYDYQIFHGITQKASLQISNLIAFFYHLQAALNYNFDSCLAKPQYSCVERSYSFQNLMIKIDGPQ